MNKRGEKPLALSGESTSRGKEKPLDLLAGESITRFDKNKKKKKKGGTNRNNVPAGNNRKNPTPTNNGDNNRKKNPNRNK